MKKLSVAFAFLVVTFLASCSNSTAFAYDSLKMLNSTGRTIYFVYLAPKGQGWKNDRLTGTWSNGNTLTLGTRGARYWALKIRFKGDEEWYWDGNNCIDTANVYMLTISRNNSGGYTLHYGS